MTINEISDATRVEAPIASASTAFAEIPELWAPLSKLGIAWENLRAGQPPDEDIPQLAETLFAAGQLEPLWCRPGGRKELPFQVLDGRRRLFGFQHLLREGRIGEDHPVRIKVLKGRAAQLAAVVLPNQERALTHHADVISAIARLKRRKMSTLDMAAALGYSAKDIQGWQALADLDPAVLDAYRNNAVTLTQAKLLTKLAPEAQRQLIARAEAYGYIDDYAIRQRIAANTTTVGDPRLKLVGLDAYAAAGGRVEQDLFGECEDVLLDPEILQGLFDARLQLVIEPLKASGLAVYIAAGHAYSPPDGYFHLSHLRARDLTAEEQARIEACDCDVARAREALAEAAGDGATAPERVARLLLAQIEREIARRPKERVGAVVVYPCGEEGADVCFFASPAPTEDDDRCAAEIQTADPDRHQALRRPDVVIQEKEVDVEGRTNALHERYTDVATRGLIRAVADDPVAALTLLLARLFCNLALESAGSPEDSISTIRASRYRRHPFQPIEVLDGEVTARLATRRDEYLASKLRPVAWIHQLAHGEKMTLLAELTAVSLDGREAASTQIRHGARAEAAEMADLTDHRIATHWTPDLAFFAAHTKKGLARMLESMGGAVATAATLKKDDLAAHVTEEAAARLWAPEALSWRQAASEVEAETLDGDVAEPEEPTKAPRQADDALAEASDGQTDDEAAANLQAAA